MNSFKTIVNNTLKNLQIIIYQPPRFIDDLQEIQTILRNYHDTPTGGHIGQHRLYLKLREQYTWRDMKSSISRFVKACESCKKNKIIKHTKEKMVVTTTPSSPFEIISIDTVGPLPISIQGNRYAISIQCDLTKYIILIPIKTKEAQIIAKALVENFILIYGSFIELRSDQGTEYKNDVLDRICKLLGIRQSFATAYHPQTIGSLERNHRCLNEYLRSFINDQKNDWDEWMKFYSYSYNTTPHTDHGFTPYELVFGRKSNLPHEIYEKGIEPVYNLNEYYYELKYKIQRTNEIAKENLIKHKILRKDQYEAKSNSIQVHVGDSVYLTNENRKKLDEIYTGPYTVVEVSEPNCKIQDPITTKITEVHLNRLIV